MLALASLGGAALDQLLKLFFHRMRPETAGEVINVQGYSFPSGHAMMSLCFYGMLIYLLVAERSRLARVIGLAAAIALIGMIGLSRIYLGVHWQIDADYGYDTGTAVGDWMFSHYLRPVAAAVGPNGDQNPGLAIAAIRPNPTRGATEVRLVLPEAGRLDAAIYDATGRAVTRFPQSFSPAGEFALQWDPRHAGPDRLSAGVYFLRAAVVGGASQNAVQARIVVLP